MMGSVPQWSAAGRYIGSAVILAVGAFAQDRGWLIGIFIAWIVAAIADVVWITPWVQRRRARAAIMARIKDTLHQRIADGVDADHNIVFRDNRRVDP